MAVPLDVQKLALDVDSQVVKASGGTFSGGVTFNTPPSIPLPTINAHAANKEYVDAVAADVTAIETELGTNPSGTFSTVVERLDTYTDGFDDVGNLLTANQATPTETGLFTLDACTEGAAGVFTADSTSFYAARYNISTGITPGETYTFTADLAPTGRAMYVYVLWYEAGPGAGVGAAVGNTIAAGSSGVSKVTAVAPAGAGYARLYAAYSSTGSAGDSVTVTKIGFWKGSGGQWSMPGTPIVGGSHIATNGAVHLSGTGVPESVITAAPGSTWLQTDSTTTASGWLRWIKNTGTGSTGWVAGADADTGWRDVSAQLENGWAGGYFLLRRIGNRVEFNIAALSAASATSGTPYTLPTGFRIGAPYAAHRGIWYKTDMTLRRISTDRVSSPIVVSNYAAADTLYGSDTGFTVDAWPTSLPGVAA